MTSQTRKEIEAHFIDFIAKAEAEGKDGFNAAIAAFPDVPEMVIIMASAEYEHRKTEAWWQSMERTIDGEVISRAIEAQAKESGQ